MTRPNDWSLITALGALVCLLAMAAVSLVAGVSQETFEIVREPREYAGLLVKNASAVRALFGIDSAFLVLYSAFFVVFVRRIATERTRSWLWVALVFLLFTAVLDMVEDHHILALLYSAELAREPAWEQLTFQHTLSSVKFNVSYVGLFLLGMGVPRETWAGWGLTLLLTVGTVLQGAWLYAAPPEMLPTGNLGRHFGYVLGFLLVLPLLRRPAHTPART
jgi:hypothetical protein